MKAKEKLIECVICREPIEPIGTWRFGHNAAPIVEGGRCCSECNECIVIPYRFKRMLQARKGSDT